MCVSCPVDFGRFLILGARDLDFDMKVGDWYFKLSNFNSRILSGFGSVESGDGLGRQADHDMAVTCLSLAMCPQIGYLPSLTSDGIL